MPEFTSPLEFKAPEVTKGGGDFYGYAAVFNTEDLGGDTIERGAFAETISEIKRRGAPLPLLWSHDYQIVLGKFTELSEDQIGLFVRGRLSLGTAEAREKYALLKDRAVTGLSIGYRLGEGGVERQGSTRRLKKIHLDEVSLVAMPMHPDARVTEVKSIAATTRSLEKYLREHPDFLLSRQTARKAASVLWPILNERDAQTGDRDDHGAGSELVRLLKSSNDELDSFSSFIERL